MKDRAIHQALCKFSSAVAPTSANEWMVELRNGKPFRCSAGVLGEWLVMHASVNGAEPDAWGLLRLNGRIQGPAKVAVNPRSGLTELRAELPLNEDTDVATRVREACASLCAAHAMVLGEALAPAEDHPLKPGAVDVLQLVTEAGWTGTSRSDGQVAVDLGVKRSYRQALVRHTSNSMIAAVDVDVLSGQSEAARRAMTAALLTGSWIVRMVKATLEERDGASVARYEVWLGEDVAAEELGHALSSLAVACELTVREVAALKSPEIATAYLGMRAAMGTASAVATK